MVCPERVSGCAINTKPVEMFLSFRGVEGSSAAQVALAMRVQRASMTQRWNASIPSRWPVGGWRFVEFLDLRINHANFRNGTPKKFADLR
jgi:hypothetical protein